MVIPWERTWGDLEAIVDRAIQDTLRAIPDATMQVYHRAGHAPRQKDPKRFAADLVEFVREHGASLIRRMAELPCLRRCRRRTFSCNRPAAEHHWA